MAADQVSSFYFSCLFLGFIIRIIYVFNSLPVQLLAEELGLRNLGEIPGFPGHFLWEQVHEAGGGPDRRSADRKAGGRPDRRPADRKAGGFPDHDLTALLTQDPRNDLTFFYYCTCALKSVKFATMEKTINVRYAAKRNHLRLTIIVLWRFQTCLQLVLRTLNRIS
jgi:hypothetical protein